MRAERTARRGPAAVVALTTGRRAARSGAVWGALFGLLIFDEASRYYSDMPTAEARRSLAETFGDNRSIAAVIGPARHLDTIEGYVAWRMFGLLIIVGAIWGLLLATRLTRGEEDAGRWEVLLAGRTNRRHAAAQAIGGLATGLLVLWALTAALTVAVGLRSDVRFPVQSSLFYATASTASAAMFLAIGALAGQLGSTRRQANGLAGCVFAASYLVRMVADASSGSEWMRWASPLGWVENLQPLVGSRPLALLPILVLTAGAAWGAVVLAGRRDVGAGVLSRDREVAPDTRLLTGPALFAVRLERWVATAWIAGLAALAVVFGAVARSAAEAEVGVKGIEEAVERLGGEQGGVAGWIGYEFLYLAALVAFVAAGQVGAIRREEAEGRLDNFLARALSRHRWLLGRLGLATAIVAIASLACAAGGWIGVAGGQSDVGAAAMLEAGVNVGVPAIFVLGLGTLLLGVLPRLAVPILYTFVLWSFVIEIVGSSVATNHWLLDTAVLSHLGPVPATDLRWGAIAWLTGLAVVGAALGVAAFERRDLSSA